MTDNGSAYRSRHWGQVCGAYGLCTSASNPTAAHQRQGRAGYSDQLARAGLRAVYTSSQARQDALADWLGHYNRASEHPSVIEEKRLC